MIKEFEMQKKDMTTKERIYNTAKRLYLEQGFSDTPNTMIAQEADVNLGLITYYYKTKDLIASDMLNNNYETLHFHLSKFLPANNPLLELIAFYRLHFELIKLDSDYNRFMYEMNKFDLVEKATRDGNLVNVYKTIINENDLIKNEDKNRICDFAVTTTSGILRALSIKLYEEKTALSQDEVFFLLIDHILYTMSLNCTKIVLESLIKTAKHLITILLHEYPQLQKPSNYLYI